MSALLCRRLAFTTTRVGFDKDKKYRGVGQKSVSDQAVNPLSKPSNIDKGALHVVSVPIGNLKDFSLRSIEVLRKVDYIACTNRQVTRTLLDLVDIDASGRLIHMRDGGNPKLVEMLRGGRSMALVVPGGTPCVGDGGNDLVREMIANNVRVTSVPGPCSIISALSISGVRMAPDGAFFFGGYLPEGQGYRKRQLKQCAFMPHPSVFFEYPRRILGTLGDIASVMPQRRVSLLHELTKLHESLHSDTASKLSSYYTRAEALKLIEKGQLVIVIEGCSPDEEVDDRSGEHKDALYYRLVMQNMESVDGDVPSAARLVANTISVPFSEVMECYSAQRERLEAAERSQIRQTEALAKSNAPLPTRKEILKLRRKRRRERLIRKIEKEQERLRLTMAASKFHTE